MHACRVVIHGRGATLHHSGVHVGHHHPSGVKVHGQMRRSYHVARLVQGPTLLGCRACLRRRAWGGTLWGLGLRGQLALGCLPLLLLLLLLQQLLLLLPLETRRERLLVFGVPLARGSCLSTCSSSHCLNLHLVSLTSTSSNVSADWLFLTFSWYR